MAPSLRNLLRSRIDSSFDKDVKSIGILPSICEALNKYDLFNYFKYGSTVQYFPRTATGNQLSKIKFVTWRVGCSWNFVLVIRACMLHKLAKEMSLHPNSGPQQTFTRIWSVVFIPKSDSWVICLNGCIPWLFKTESFLCFTCKENTETVYHHFIECLPFRDNYNSLRSNLKTKIINFNQTDGIKVCTISFERPVNYLCDAWHVFPPRYEAWTHFNN